MFYVEVIRSNESLGKPSISFTHPMTELKELPNGYIICTFW